MKIRKHQINKAGQWPKEPVADPSSDEMLDDAIGTKGLYNWLYQQEEENYYKSEHVAEFLPEFVEEALFVEY